MRYFFLIACAGSSNIAAQKKLGVFNSLSIGVSGGTLGIGVDLAAPIGNHFTIRMGISHMPNFSINAEADVYSNEKYDEDNSYNELLMDLKGEFARTSTEVLLNIYPFKSSSFFLCGGAYFGGKRLLKISGHSDDALNLIPTGSRPFVQIDKYLIPIDKEGNLSGQINVASFRPYAGIGFGRAVPKKRIGLMFEAGVQFHKSPKIEAEGLEIIQVDSEEDTEFSDILNKLTIYPVIKLRICGRLF